MNTDYLFNTIINDVPYQVHTYMCQYMLENSKAPRVTTVHKYIKGIFESKGTYTNLSDEQKLFIKDMVYECVDEQRKDKDFWDLKGFERVE